MDIKMHIIHIKDEAIALDFPNGEECLEGHGFGMFLVDWKPGELVITPEAKRIILENGKEMDLGGIEFLSENHIGFMQNPIPSDGISCDSDSKKWVRELPEVEHSEAAERINRATHLAHFP